MRCADCLDDLRLPYYVAVVARRAGTDPDDSDSIEYDERSLCRACAGWYRETQEITE